MFSFSMNVSCEGNRDHLCNTMQTILHFKRHNKRSPCGSKHKPCGNKHKPCRNVLGSEGSLTIQAVSHRVNRERSTLSAVANI